MILLLLAVQAAAPNADAPQTHSILLADCPTVADGDDILVCARPQQGGLRVPLPAERLPVGPLMVTGAAERMVDPTPRPAGGTPCAASQSGCQVVFGPPLMPIVKGAVSLIKGALAKRPDTSGRVPILLDAPPPTGTLLP